MSEWRGAAFLVGTRSGEPVLVHGWIKDGLALDEREGRVVLTHLGTGLSLGRFWSGDASDCFEAASVVCGLTDWSTVGLGDRSEELRTALEEFSRRSNIFVFLAGPAADGVKERAAKAVSEMRMMA